MPVLATFGEVEYLQDDLIKVPVGFNVSIVVLEPSDFDIQGVILSDAYTRGEGTSYELYLTPQPETHGVMSLELDGKVYRSDATSISDTQFIDAPILLVPYNTREPLIVGQLFPPLILTGLQSVYIDFREEVTGITKRSWIISGIDIPVYNIYAAETPTTTLPIGERPLPSAYIPYNNSDIPRRYFRLDFVFPDPTPFGNLGIDLRVGGAKVYINKDIMPILPDINLSLTQGVEFDQKYKVTASKFVDIDVNGFIPLALGYHNNILHIYGTPTTVGSGQVVITLEGNPIGHIITWEVHAPQRRERRQTLQQQSGIPTLSMQDAVLYVNEDFDVSGSISGNPTEVWVEGLLRKWRYTYASGNLHVLGDAEDVTRIESNVWNVIMEYEAQISVTTSPVSLIYDSGNLASAFSLAGVIPIHLGNINNANFVREDIAGGSVYKFTYDAQTTINSLRVRINMIVSQSNTLVVRYAATAPTTSNFTSHGTVLSRHTATSINTDNSITRPARELYLWAYLTTFSSQPMTVSQVYDSGTVNVFGIRIPIHIGRNPSGEIGIEQETVNDLSVYRTTSNLTNLRIRLNFNFNVQGTNLEIRYSSTAPASGETAYLSHGTRLVRTSSGSSVDVSIANAPTGTYFWIFLPVGGSISFTRLRLDATSETLSVTPQTLTNRRLRLNAVGTHTSSAGTETRYANGQVNWRVIERAPVITNPGPQVFYLNSTIDLDINITHEPSGVTMTGLQARMGYERADVGARLIGSPDRLVSVEDNRQITVNASTSGGDDTESFGFSVESGIRNGLLLNFHESNTIPKGFAFRDGIIEVPNDLSPYLIYRYNQANGSFIDTRSGINLSVKIKMDWDGNNYWILDTPGRNAILEKRNSILGIIDTYVLKNVGHSAGIGITHDEDYVWAFFNHITTLRMVEPTLVRFNKSTNAVSPYILPPQVLGGQGLIKIGDYFYTFSSRSLKAFNTSGVLDSSQDRSVPDADIIPDSATISLEQIYYDSDGNLVYLMPEAQSSTNSIYVFELE